MVEIDYNSLNEEELKYFQDKYIDMFERIKEYNSKMKSDLEEIIGDVSKVNTIDMTTFGKLLFVAKKVLVNSAITFTTGIEPRFLENGVDNFFSSDRRRERYKKSNQRLLAYSITQELEVGIDKTLAMLRETDIQKLRTTLRSFDSLYRELKADNYKIDEVSECFSPQIIYFMVKYLKTLNMITYDKIEALVSNKIHLGINVNIAKELIETIESQNVKGGKTR